MHHDRLLGLAQGVVERNGLPGPQSGDKGNPARGLLEQNLIRR
jgi:hypothetical protein